MRRFFASLLEVVEVTIVALGAVYLIRTFLVQPFLVSGHSMAPNFSDGDYLLVDQIVYHFRPPQRGEVVVFRYPRDESAYFIKRIIGLPGERLEIKNGKVWVWNSDHPDGFVLGERYLPGGEATLSRSGEKAAFVLGPNEYLVLGDNRQFSFDSRDWGILPASDIVGLARLRLWPPKGLTVFAAPAY
jgi:signal peptidase I